jgi:hypothetical protein
MRTLSFLASTALALFVLAEWWRAHRRVGVEFMNRTVNPWLERRGVLGSSRGELGLIEHVGRISGTVRQTPIHPMPIAGGFRIIVPVGERSEWARNVLAAGRCRLLVGDRTFDLDEPVLETPADVPDLPRPVRALFGWLGFRYLRLRTFETAETPAEAAAPAQIAAAAETVAVPV